MVSVGIWLWCCAPVSITRLMRRRRHDHIRQPSLARGSTWRTACLYFFPSKHNDVENRLIEAGRYKTLVGFFVDKPQLQLEVSSL
jgi:hypothetical protein